MDGTLLDARAFAAEAAFVYPEESREVARSLLRNDFAAREAGRLGLSADAARAAAELADFEASLRAELGPQADLEAWARRRYACSWEEVRRVLGEHLERNQLYQLCVRAEARLQTRLRLHWLVTADPAQAEEWARQLRSGLDPRTLLPASALAGTEADGSFTPIPARLPRPFTGALQGQAAGAVVGPFQFEGDRAWWVGRVAEVLQPEAALPPVAILLQDLDQRPLQALEIRTWFEAMADRYTANGVVPAISGPPSAFVPAR